MTSRDLAFRDWVARARAADLVQVAERFGPKLRRAGRELVGPCPVCGGTDRFALNPDLGVFNCRGGAGGDVIDLVAHLTGRDFVGVCEEITGEPPPGRNATETAEERVRREARLAADLQAAEAARAERDADGAAYREAERRRAYGLWCDGAGIVGSIGEVYLGGRGVHHLQAVRLRFLPRLGYFETVDGSRTKKQIAETPAMLAAITEVDGRFAGVHITHLDPAGRGKARIVHPVTGEACDAKKVRGSQKGRWIRLSGADDASHLVIGEGIETVLSVREAMIVGQRDMGDRVFAAAINLGNLGGPAVESVRHPGGLTVTDKAGRARVKKIPGPVPDMTKPAIRLPPSIRTATILGDGDSEAAETRWACDRIAARWRGEGVTTHVAMAAPGTDFNDMWMSETGTGHG